MTADAPGVVGQRARLFRLLVLILAGVLVVTWGFVVWLVAGKSKAQDDLADARAEIDAYAAGPQARDAAEEVLLEMLSYDHREMDDEYAWLENFANADLRKRFERQAPKLRKVIERSRATAEGEVVQSAYTTVDADTVTVLAFVRQRLTDAQNKQGLVEEQWTTLALVREGDRWLIEGIDIVTVPPNS